uniref:Nucleoside diphosphate kinase homolog 7 n=1 Tax=Anolis carolinensis TaxID=28377 RepID=G1KKD0_ANOCA
MQQNDLSRRLLQKFLHFFSFFFPQSQDERFAFVAEWYDSNASLFRRYELLYYPKDGSVEMYDMKNRCRFLNRTKYEDLHFKDLFVGNRITIFSRHLNLVDYADQYTARMLGSSKERTLALLKPDAALKLGDILDLIINSGFTISKAKMMQLSRAEATDFHADHLSKPYYNELLEFITSGPVVALEILGDDAISRWKNLLGPANSVVARSDSPDSIRALFGTDGIRNVAHGPDSFASAARFYMDRANADEFYAIYKGVVAEYPEMVVELCSGPCIALEIRQIDPEKIFRDFCGPSDPEIARYLRPGTLRAIYGKNKIQNAVHCTDLPEDGLLEVRLYEILSNIFSTIKILISM